MGRNPGRAQGHSARGDRRAQAVPCCVRHLLRAGPEGLCEPHAGPAAVREEEAERAITTEVEHRRAQLAGLMAPFRRHLNARRAAAEPSREAEEGRRRGEEEGS